MKSTQESGVHAEAMNVGPPRNIRGRRKPRRWRCRFDRRPISSRHSHRALTHAASTERCRSDSIRLEESPLTNVQLIIRRTDRSLRGAGAGCTLDKLHYVSRRPAFIDDVKLRGNLGVGAAPIVSPDTISTANGGANARCSMVLADPVDFYWRHAGHRATLMHSLTSVPMGKLMLPGCLQ